MNQEMSLRTPDPLSAFREGLGTRLDFPRDLKAWVRDYMQVPGVQGLQVPGPPCASFLLNLNFAHEHNAYIHIYRHRHTTLETKNFLTKLQTI